MIFCFGIISQIKLWKLYEDRRKRKEADRITHEENLDRIDTEVGRRVIEQSDRDRVRWEAVYGDKNDKDPSVLVKELSSASDTLELSDLSRSSGNTAPTSWTDSFEHKQPLADVHEEDEITEVDRDRLGSLQDVSQRISSTTGTSSNDQAPPIARRGSYLEERASLRTSMPPPPPMINLPFNPATGTLQETEKVSAETDKDAGLLKESKGSFKKSKRNSGGIARTSSFRSTTSSFSDKRKSASEEDLLVPHLDDRRSSIAATLDILDEDQMSLRSLSDRGESSSEHGERLVTEDQPASADEQSANEADGLQADESTKAPKGFLVPSTKPESVSGSEGASKRLSGVSIADIDDEEELRPAPVVQDSKSVSDLKPESVSVDLADHLPEKLSKIALSYRTNEWAKHLEAADLPEVEEIPEPESPGVQVDPTFAETVRKESAAKNVDSDQAAPAAPAVVQADGFKAAPRLERRQTEPDQSRLRGQHSVPTSIAPQLSRNGSSTTINVQKGTSRAAMQSEPNLLRSVSQSTTTSNLSKGKSKRRLSSMPLVNEEAVALGSSTTLLGQRDSVMTGRMSRTASQLNVAASGNSSRPASRQLLANESSLAINEEDMPLSQRRQMIQAKRRSSSGNTMSPPMAPMRSPSTSALPALALGNFDSHQPQRGPSRVDTGKKEAMLAHWRHSLMNDARNSQQIQESQDDERRQRMMEDKRQKEAWKKHEDAQKGAAERERDSLMRSGGMLDAHKEAMRKMQAESRRRSGL